MIWKNSFSFFNDGSIFCKILKIFKSAILSSGIFSNSSMLRSLCNVCEVFYLLRRRMPWLEDRWRTQRTVLNISNCRFPRKKWILNAFCELTSCQLTWLAVTEICSRSNSEVWVVSHVVASSCADVFVWFSASLVFEQHYDLFHDVRLRWCVSFWKLKTFLRTLTTSHGITRWI